MLSCLLLTLLGCGPAKKNTSNKIQEASTSASTTNLIEFDGVKNIILIDENEQRVQAKDASEGIYDAIAVFTVEDSQGTRDEEMPLEKITLSQYYTLRIDCKWVIIDDSSAELKCDFGKIRIP